MVHTPFIFLPAGVCFVWAAILSMTAFRMRTFWHAIIIMLIMSIFGLSRACIYYEDISPFMMNAALIVRETSAICFVPMVIMYLNRLQPNSTFKYIHLSWVALPIIVMTGAIILSKLKDHAPEYTIIVEAHRFWTNDLHKIIMGVSLFGLIIYIWYYSWKYKLNIKHIWYFLKGRAPMRPAEILGLLLLLTMIASILKCPWDIAPVSIVMVIIGYFMLFGSCEEIVLKDLGSVMRYNVRQNIGPTEAAAAVLRGTTGTTAEHSTQDEEDASMFAGASIKAVPRVWDDDNLLSKFQHLMLDDQIFLQPRLTLGDVAEILHTNKTYISKMVNNSYKCGFPEVINTLRVDYAEHYLLNHRIAKQDEIASACGFLSASSFNNTFKKIAGMPPKQWMAGWDMKHGNI